MMEMTEKMVFKDLAIICEQLNSFADTYLPECEEFTGDVERNRITDINQIERTLDTIVSFCFNDKYLLLYKRILRKLLYKHPKTVNSYVDIYYDMYGKEGGGSE